MLWFIVIGLAVLLAVFALPLVRRAGLPDDVERFHRARSLTTEWARRAGGAPPAPVAPEPVEQDA